MVSTGEPARRSLARIRAVERAAAAGFDSVAWLAPAPAGIAGQGLDRDELAGPARTPPSARGPFDFDPASVVLLRARAGVSRDRAIQALRLDPAFEWVEPNLERTTCDFPADGSLPLDPLLRDTRQWGLWNAGEAGVHRGLAGADIGARAAWAITCGSNDLRLALADTGVDPGHPDLQRRMDDGSPRLAFGRSLADAVPGAWADSNGHGTAVAGVMAALTNDGAHFDSLGVAGVCGGDGRDNAGCRLIPIKVTTGASGAASSFHLAAAIVRATDLGARALNLSFAGGGGSRIERSALLYAITRGCVVVAASGNRGHLGPGVMYPAAFAAHGLCVSVGASDARDRRAAFSSYGPELDLVAPGLDVWTTSLTYPNAYGARYPGALSTSGTSFAAPHVAGAIGLMATLRPELGDTDFQQLLRRTAHDLGPAGRDDATGAGRLDVAAALAALADPPGARLAVVHDERAATVRPTGRFSTLAAALDGFGTFDRGAEWSGRWVEQFEAVVTIEVPDSLDAAAEVWPRAGGTTTLRGDFRLPVWAPWAEVAARDGRRVTLRGWLYRVPWAGDAGIETPPDSADFWLPLPPDQARIGFTVFGRVVPRARAADVPRPRSAGGLTARPHPASGPVRLAGPPGAAIAILDLAGRTVAAARLDPVRGEWTWDGRDRRGRRVPAGLYFARGADAGIGVARIVVLGGGPRE